MWMLFIYKMKQERDTSWEWEIAKKKNLIFSMCSMCVCVLWFGALAPNVVCDSVSSNEEKRLFSGEKKKTTAKTTKKKKIAQKQQSNDCCCIENCLEHFHLRCTICDWRQTHCDPCIFISISFLTWNKCELNREPCAAAAAAATR